MYGYALRDPVNLQDYTGNDWVYNQSTGVIHQEDSSGGVIPGTSGGGYSGNGDGLNNPSYEAVPDVGPIPTGDYTIGNSYNSDSVGPNTISLEPTNGTDTHGRFAFKIHGERRNGPSGQASKGCIIQSSRIRNKIINSGDRKLKVIAR